jgi:hypothetical protein
MTDRNIPWGVHTIRDIFGSTGCSAGLPGGRVVRAIPEPYSGNRLVAAWWVLTGRAYALIWPKHGDLEVALDIPERKRPRAV